MVNKIDRSRRTTQLITCSVWSNIAMEWPMLRPVSDHTTGILGSYATIARKNRTAFYSSLVSRLIEFSGLAM
jgi:hypothetical protein